MADNFLETHREDYERRKALWLKKQGRLRKGGTIQRPEDESL